jgi:hypothetical protein
MAAMAVSMPPRARRETAPRLSDLESALRAMAIHMLLPPASIVVRGARTFSLTSM